MTENQSDKTILYSRSSKGFRHFIPGRNPVMDLPVELLTNGHYPTVFCPQRQNSVCPIQPFTDIPN